MKFSEQTAKNGFHDNREHEAIDTHQLSRQNTNYILMDGEIRLQRIILINREMQQRKLCSYRAQYMINMITMTMSSWIWSGRCDLYFDCLRF